MQPSIPVFVTLSTLLILFASSSLQSDPEVLGEGFPSCLEVVDIYPHPFTVVQVETFDRSYRTFTVEIKFSKPVFIKRGDTTLGNHYQDFPFGGNRKVFITGSHLKMKPICYAGWIRHSGTNMKTISVKFFIDDDAYYLIRKFYIVVDGGAFYSYETFYTGRHRVYAPLAVFGEYYFFWAEAVNKTPQSIQPSPYCSPRSSRPLPTPMYSDAKQQKGGSGIYTVDIPASGHRVVNAPNTKTSKAEYSEAGYVLHLSGVVKGYGSASIPLPLTVMAEYKGVNVTVKLPPWKLQIDKNWVYFIVPVTRKVVYELRERIYLYQRRKEFPLGGPPLPMLGDHHDLLPRTAVTKDPNHAAWRMELFDPTTGFKLMDIFTPPDDHLRPPPSRNTHAYNRWLELKLPNLNWHALTMTASAHARPPTDSSIPSQKAFPKHNVRMCPAGSKRNLGRYGRLYHTVELGPFYHMLIPELQSLDKWEVHSAHKIRLVAEDGKVQDVTNRVSFGDNYGGIPPRLIQALSKYVCLIQPLGSDEHSMARFPRQYLERCIFVPVEVAKSRNCGGLRLFENIGNITKDEDFCSKDFGDCIGLPYTSVERFPVLPPYGLPELSGWHIRHHKASSADMLHSIGKHLDIGTTGEPVWRTWFQLRRQVFSLNPHPSAELPIDNIPIDDTEILEPYLAGSGEEDPGSFCETVWKLKPLLMDRTSETKAVLSATVYNDGEGGGQFVFGVQCAPLLIVRPSLGYSTSQWIPEHTGVKVEFKLDGQPSAGYRKKVHKCELTVRVETIPELSPVGNSENCTRWITTYYGAFQDPCIVSPALPLPQLDLSYYVLPAHQRRSSSTALKQFLSSPAGRPLVFMKAITISLTVPEYEEELVSSLHEMKAYCTSPEVVVLREDQLVYEASQPPQDQLSHTPVTFHAEFTAKRRIYYFASRQWVLSQNSSMPQTSGCKVEVWANTPHHLCKKQPKRLADMFVPLRQADVAAIQGEKAGAFWFLAPAYGSQPDEVAIALLACLITTIVLGLATVSGHGVLFALRKRLPKQSNVIKLQKQLEKVKKADKEYWGNPQMFLTAGPHGPYYLLHSFRATDALDTGDVTNMKIAGTLKYKSKELQVLFGHVKKIFVDKSGETGDVWLQASSGMYLLPVQNVTADYKDEFTAFLQRQGINIVVDNIDKEQPVASDFGEGELPDDGESEDFKRSQVSELPDEELAEEPKKEGTVPRQREGNKVQSEMKETPKVSAKDELGMVESLIDFDST